jgi:hypothetical protein
VQLLLPWFLFSSNLTTIWNPAKAKSAEALRTSAHSMGLSTEFSSSTFLENPIQTKDTDRMNEIFKV